MEKRKMKLKKVFILSGPPASGKSTWVRTNLTVGSEWISRDNVRFAILTDEDDYFAHEDDVFDTFINYINQTLENPDIHTIYIDATHLNKRSRNKTLRRVNRKNIGELNCVCFTTPKAVCHARNNLRPGRSKVPASAIDNMFNAYALPTKDEGFDHIYDVNENGIIKEV
jgi:predicted kinase